MRHLTFLFLLAVLLAAVSCCSPSPADPQPTADLDQMIQRSVHQWLDVRVVDQDQLDRVQAPDADWRTAHSWADLRASSVLSELGNVFQIRSQIEESGFYKRGPPSDLEVVLRVRAALDSYIWEE